MPWVNISYLTLHGCIKIPHHSIFIALDNCSMRESFTIFFCLLRDFFPKAKCLCSINFIISMDYTKWLHIQTLFPLGGWTKQNKKKHQTWKILESKSKEKDLCRIWEKCRGFIDLKVHTVCKLNFTN